MYDYDKFLDTLRLTKDINNSLYKILQYDFIYHSNKIEGSTFTTEALQMLIEKNVVTGTHTLDDIQSSVNSFYTMDLVLDDLNKPLSISMINYWHGSLMYRTRLYEMGLAGVLKKFPNKILGTNFDTVQPYEVEDRLTKLIYDYNKLEKPTLEDICKFHLEFEKIHPYQDGNGRIGRFIFLKQLLENKLPLKYMNGETSDDYKKALDNSTKDNVNPLIDYINSQKDFIKENKNMF